MLLELFSRKPKPNETPREDRWMTIVGDCMAPHFRNGDILVGDEIVTNEPVVGDLGVIRVLREGQLVHRLGVWGPKNGSKRQILSTNKGVGHDEIEEIDESEFQAMLVKKTLTKNAFQRLLDEITK